MLIRHGICSRWILGTLLAILFACTSAPSRAGTGLTTTGSPTPTPDPLAEPALPANPTQVEQGRHLYWLNCMPCHGDRGQGLTPEFRSLWEEGHQNCWARGCHAGRPGDQGFPLPKTIPALVSSSANLLSLANAEELFAYLHTTHPPQRPGDLPEEEYWAITAYVLAENGRLPPGQELGPQAGIAAAETILKFAAVGLVLLMAVMIIVWSHKRQNSQLPPDLERR